MFTCRYAIGDRQSDPTMLWSARISTTYSKPLSASKPFKSKRLCDTFMIDRYLKLAISSMFVRFLINIKFVYTLRKTAKIDSFFFFLRKLTTNYTAFVGYSSFQWHYMTFNINAPTIHIYNFKQLRVVSNIVNVFYLWSTSIWVKAYIIPLPTSPMRLKHFCASYTVNSFTGYASSSNTDIDVWYCFYRIY